VKNATCKQDKIEWRLGTILINAKIKDIKKRLWKVWEKEAIRIEPIIGSWERRRVNLGKGSLKIQGIVPVHEILNTIEDFGINLHALKKMDPKYDELFEIYEAIKTYRLVIRYLKDLKVHMGAFQNFKEWRT